MTRSTASDQALFSVLRPSSVCGLVYDDMPVGKDVVWNHLMRVGGSVQQRTVLLYTFSVDLVILALDYQRH